ncbi:asparaginase [Natrialbaceae archaeon A-CW2]
MDQSGAAERNVSRPEVHVLSTGGTIASTAGEDGKTPSESGSSVLEAVPDIEALASVTVEDICQVSGFQMDGPNANAVADAVERAARSGADGVVVTHGTDTMAETAYFLETVLEAELPVVCTGSQRSFDQLGTDGPTNLRLAVRAAADERFRDAGGVYVAFNETVHAARDVVKHHTSKLETFQSPNLGPVAVETPTGLRFSGSPGPRVPPIPGARFDPDVQVAIVTNALGADGGVLEAALEGPDAVDGIVLAGTGLGNATASLGGVLEQALEGDIPVVLTSRCYAGSSAGVYGGSGGATTLLETGAILGSDLPAWKARLTLWLALGAGKDRTAIRALFDELE